MSCQRQEGGAAKAYAVAAEEVTIVRMLAEPGRGPECEARRGAEPACMSRRARPQLGGKSLAAETFNFFLPTCMFLNIISSARGGPTSGLPREFWRQRRMVCADV